jgi:pilus assembly protein CpaF
VSLLAQIRRRPPIQPPDLAASHPPEALAPLAPTAEVPVLTPPGPGAAEPRPRSTLPRAPGRADFADLKVRIHEELIHELDPAQLVGDTGLDSPIRRAVEQAADERIAQADESVGPRERARLASEVADEVLGLGPLEPLLRDPTVSEIMVNSPTTVFCERRGMIDEAPVAFRDDAHLLHTIDKILGPIGRRLDESSPMVDARLADGSRVNAIVPPLAVHGPALTIRKFSRDLLTAADLIRFGTLSEDAVAVLGACVRARLNVLVSGGTGTGKTTLLNVLSAFIPRRERIVTIEDPAELQINHPNWISLETRPPNIEGRGQVVQRDLLRNALRMRPDRIIVGECRAGEAFDMLQAMNTGHDGSLTTVHANSPRDALARVENMVLMAGLDLPVQAIREQIASGLDVVVHLSRLADGSRRVSYLSEIVGMEGAVILTHDVFLFEQTAVGENGRVLGRLVPTGVRPRFVERLEQHGERLPASTFFGASR